MSLKKPPLKLFTIYILLSLLLLGLDRLKVLTPVKAFFETFTIPLKQALWQGYQGLNQDLEKRSFEASSLILLKEKASHQELENLSLKAKNNILEEENESLRRLLGAPLPPAWQFIPASVLAKKDQVIEINQGEKEGVKEEAAVVLENILVGEIVEVNPHTAKVRLVNHPGFNSPARIQEAGAEGKVKVSGNRIFIEEIPLEASLGPGDLVTRQKDSLVLGSLGKILTDPKESWQRAELIWPIEVEKLKTVFVVKREN